jgi:hypothetical protein
LSPSLKIALLALAPDELLTPSRLLQGVERSPDAYKLPDARTVPFVDNARKTPIVEKSEVVPCPVCSLLSTSGTTSGDLAGEVPDLFQPVEVDAR